MAGTTPLSDEQSVIDVVGPLAYAQTSTISTSFLPLVLDRRIQFVASIGTNSAGTNALGFSVVQATDTNGANVKAISGLSLANYTNSAQAAFVFDVRGADLDTNNGFDTCALVITGSGTISATVGIVALGDPEITPPTPVGTVVDVVYLR